MKKINSGFITAASLIIIGVLFMIFKGEIISIAMTVIGVALIAVGIADLLKRSTVMGIIKLALGLLVLLAGWLFITLALYILGASLLISGVTELYSLSKIRTKKLTLPVVLRYAQPIIYVLIAICLFFNQGGAISGVFTIAGVFLIVDGVIALLGALGK